MSPRAAASSLTPCSLELGGKDALIVLDGAPLERAANVAVFYAMMNAGQSCVSIERVYAEASIYDELVAKIVAKVAALRVGRRAGRAASTSARSPRRAQLEMIEAHVADALVQPARAWLSAGTGCPAPAPSSSRRCWSTSTTRCAA